MKTKAMARDAARIVHGPAAEVRCRRHYAREGRGPGFRVCYLAEVFGRAAVKGPGLKRGRRVVLEGVEASSPAAAYDALCAQLHGRAYVQRIEHVSDHGAIGVVAVSVGRQVGRDELAPGTTVLRAFALDVEGDAETIGAAVDIVTRLIGGAK
jgi:hypothetical protein